MLGEYGLNFFAETLLMMLGVLAGGLIERKLRFWHRVFARARMKNRIFAWVLAVLVIGSIGGIFRNLLERSIVWIGASEMLAEVFGVIVFGFAIGMAVFYEGDERKNST